MHVLYRFSCFWVFEGTRCGLKSARLLCPWNSPGKNTGVGCHTLLQGVFLTNELNPCLLCLLCWQVGSLPLVPLGKPVLFLLPLKLCPTSWPTDSFVPCILREEDLTIPSCHIISFLLNLFHFLCMKLSFPLKDLSSVQFSCSVVSNSLQPHGLQHARFPYLSPTPRAYSNSGPLSWWCHPTISSSTVPFSCFQSFPAARSFQTSQFFTSNGQSIGVSASASVLPMNIQDWFALGWTGLISLQSKGLSRVFSNNTVQRHQFFSTQLSLKPKARIRSSSSWLSGFSCLLCSSYYKAPSKFLNGSSRTI